MWGEWASVSAVSLYQPTMGLIYVVEYPAKATKYKYIEIALAHCSGRRDENKEWQQLLRMLMLMLEFHCKECNSNILLTRTQMDNELKSNNQKKCRCRS